MNSFSFKIRIVLVLFVMALISHFAYSQDFSLDAQVDKEEVGFGESLNLVIIISQNANSSFGNRMTIPSIKSIPNFDIASKRTGQNHQWISGVGQTTVQLMYELVPQKPGTFSIPAFSLKGPDGKNYSTKAIPIKVLPPTEDEDEGVETGKDDNDNVQSQNGGMSLWNGLLIVGIVVALIVALPIILSTFMKKQKSTDTRWTKKDLGTLVSKEEKIERAKIEPAEFTVEADENIDFNREIQRLKMTDPEVNNRFYRSYFALFMRAAGSKQSELSKELTPDELLAKIADFGNKNIHKDILKNLSKDIDQVIYANSLPKRSFGEIDKDTREILDKIS